MDEILKICDKVIPHFPAYETIDPKKISEDIISTGITYKNVIATVKLLCADGYMVVEDPFFDTYHLTGKGRKFIEDGGYSGSERKLKKSNNWKLVQNIIMVSTAVLAVGVSIKQCQISNKTNELQMQIDTLKTK